jgi:exopolyphosphatase/guanosine-5'-triphosphate,3'-diphosphate pyrophosphatase
MSDGPAPGPVRVAAIDCGTNSLRLLVADVDLRAATLADYVRRMEIVRLGQGVDATGRLAPDALARTFGVLREYAEIIKDAPASAVRMVATSATRDAANSAEFIRGVIRILGVPPEVLTGDQEAFLSFTGATAELAHAGLAHAQLATAGLGPGGAGRPAGEQLAPPYLVVDIGGGSTEFVLGAGAGGVSPAAARKDGPVPADTAPGDAAADGAAPADAAAGSMAPGGPVVGRGGGAATGYRVAGGAAAGDAPVGEAAAGGSLAEGDRAVGKAVAGGVRAAVSVDIGCVRMTERHLRSDPPTAAEIAAATADIDAAIDAAAARIPVRSARTLVGLAGSVTTVAGIALGLPAYDASRIHHARIGAANVHAVARMLLSQTRDQRARIGVMHPGRVDVIGAGALVLDRVLTRLGYGEVVASEHDILDGIAWSLAASRAG